MNPGDIILIDFPFTVPTQSKVRPAVVITETHDKYNNLVVCAISSVLPSTITNREILISKNDPAFPSTGLRVDSVVKIDRIATLRQSDVITKLGHCEPVLWDEIRNKFKNLV
ncbi:type II toxin-antitoxin system PemK/MazF family toxin [candidate division KSB1 bacterium]|nr:type II toxin-antitoxin system PemK/MazF family toxin [candidate division KSB1 bacterium]